MSRQSDLEVRPNGDTMTQYTIATWAGAATKLTQDSVEAFRQRLRGPLLSPLDAGFADATLLWNGMTSKTPALVVQPTGTGDIVAAVDFAREHGLALSVRGAGTTSPAPRWPMGA